MDPGKLGKKAESLVLSENMKEEGEVKIANLKEIYSLVWLGFAISYEAGSGYVSEGVSRQ